MTSKPGRPKTFKELQQCSFRLERRTIRSLEAWGRRQSPKLNRTEALRELVRRHCAK